jgi:hypothetical protein
MLSIEHTAVGNAGHSAASFGSLASPYRTRSYNRRYTQGLTPRPSGYCSFWSQRRISANRYATWQAIGKILENIYNKKE